MGHPCKFQWVSRLMAALLHGTLVSVSQTAALNRGCHLYSAGRPSRWALAHIIVLSIFFSSPNFSGRRLDVYHTFDTWCGPSANLECMSEMCCTRLGGNTGRKNDAKNRHLHTITQLCHAVFSQLRHVSIIGKKLVKQQYVLHMYPQYGELWPINGWHL